jgi:hypothetical protein
VSGGPAGGFRTGGRLPERRNELVSSYPRTGFEAGSVDAPRDGMCEKAET